MAYKPGDGSEQIKRLKDRFNQEAQMMRRRYKIRGTVFDFYHGFNDRSGWINTYGQGQRSRPGAPKEMSKKQVLRALKIAHAKGWTTVYFVRNGKIDQNATNMAKSLMASGEPPSIHKKMARMDADRTAAIEAELAAIDEKMTTYSERLSELSDKGLASSPEAQSIRMQDQEARKDFRKIQNYYRSGEWRHGLRVSDILPDKAFAHLGIHHRIIPALRIPFVGAVGIPGTHAFRVQQQRVGSQRAGLRAKINDRMQFGI